MQEIYNSETFITAIDTLLNSDYNKIAKRDDYLSFLNLFNALHLYKDLDKNSWINIGRDKYRSKFGRRIINRKPIWKLPIILRTLVEKGILDKINYSKQSNLTARYKYTDKFLQVLKTPALKIVSSTLLKKVVKELTIEEYNPQYQLLMSERFQIDYEAANKKLYDMLMKGELTILKLLINQFSLINLHMKRIFCKTDPKTGRVYTSYTNLKKELKQFCTIDNQPLKEVDMKAAQPTILAHYLIQKYPNIKDVQKFYHIVTKEDIYDWYASFFAFDVFGINAGMVRDDAKTEFLKYLFKKKNQGDVLFQQITRTHLPGLYKIISAERKIASSEGTNLAIKMQKVEADIFITAVSDHIQDGCLTCHDSVHFIPGLETKIVDCLQNEMKANKIVDFQINIIK